MCTGEQDEREGHKQVTTMIYALVGVVLALGWVGTTAKTKEENNQWFLIVSGLILLLFMGLRGDFTADYPNYILDFRLFETSTFSEVIQSTREVLYKLLMKVVSKATTHYQVHHFVMALLVCLPACVAIKLNSKNYLLSIFFFFALTYYGESFNITRNCIAISILLLGYPALQQKKILRWVVLVLLATGFHTSALLFMPLIIIYYIPVKKRWIISLSAIVFVIILFNRPLLEFAQVKLGIYSGYNDYSTFEMLPKKMSLGNILNIAVRCSVYLTYSFLLIRDRELVGPNLYLAIISIGMFILSFRVYLLYRFDLYLFSFFILIFPNAFQQSSLDERVKRILMWAIVVLCIIWVSFTFKGIYYPFWENVEVSFV